MFGDAAQAPWSERTWAELTDDLRSVAAIQRTVDGVGELVIEICVNAAGRGPEPMLVRLRRLNGIDGPVALVEFIRETASAAAHRIDPVTRLPDRRAIAQCVEAWRRDAAPRAARYAVMFLDLDDFKLINDRYGHAAGDDVLETLAARWLACVREHDLVARYGGDEFVVLIQDAATAEEVEPILRRLREATEEPVDAGGVPARLSVTIGVATCDSNERAIEELIAAADRDMYARKRASRS